MKLTWKKLHKLRSGNTVWRVLIRTNYIGQIYGDIEQVSLVGVKAKRPRTDGSSWQSWIIAPKRSWRLTGAPGGWFIEDLRGEGCFSTRRSAERFVREVQGGLHPSVVREVLDFEAEMDDVF